MAGPDQGGTTLALDNDGNILAAGLFNSFNGVPSATLVRLPPDSSFDSSFGDGQAGPNDTVSQDDSSARRQNPDCREIHGS